MIKTSIKKSTSLFLAILMLCSALSLCITATDNSLSNTENIANAVFTSESENSLDLSTYCLVRPENASSDLVIAAATLRAHIEQYTGVKIELKSDSETETANEILIGKTNRNEAESIYNSTKGNNWAVKQVGTKVVLAAGEICDIVNATNYFVEKCINKNSNIMVIGDGYATENAYISGFKIGSTDITSDLKVTYLANDNVGYIDAAILLADNIRRITGITPTVTTYSDSASNQILVASQTNGGTYSSVTANAMQYAITSNNNNIIIVANDEMGAEMGTQKIIEAMVNTSGETIDLSTLVQNTAYTYTYGNNLNLEYGAEHRIMTYNLERIELNADDDNVRSTKLMNNILFYNPDVIGFQEFCVELKGKLRTKFTDNGYTLVEPEPELYSNEDNSCSDNYSMTNNYTPIAYKTSKFTFLEQGSKRIIPCRPNSNDYSNTIQSSYGWPGYCVTWVVLKDTDTGDVFAVTSLHNLTNPKSTVEDYEAKLANALAAKADSLAKVKSEVVDIIAEKYSCPVFMVGDYNSSERSSDIKSFVNEANNIYSSLYIAERGYASCASHHDVTTPTLEGSVIDHIFVTGNAKVLRHRYGMDAKVFEASDHKPTFVDVVIGEKFSVSDSQEIFSGHGSSMYVNSVSYNRVENVIGDIFADNGPLAITEVATHATAGYDFVEVMNVSNKEIDLYDYYIHRDTRSYGTLKKYSATVVTAIMYQGTFPTATVKHRLASETMTLEPGEVAIIWLTSLGDSYKADDFKATWGISDSTTKISKVTISEDHTITQIYTGNHTLNKKQPRAKGDYLSRNHKVSYSLTIAHADFSEGLANYDIYRTGYNDISVFPSGHIENQLILRRMASCIVAVLCDDLCDASCNATTTCTEKGNISVVFKSFHTAETLQAAIDKMDPAADKNAFASDFVGPFETTNTEEACFGIYNSEGSTKDIITPLPYFEFTTNVTPGTVSEFSTPNQGGEVTPDTVESAVVVEGVQSKKNANNTADLRFVASLKGSYLNYLEAGFEFTFNGQVAKIDCKHVYRTLNSNAEVISAEDYNADYFICYTLKNLSAGTYTIDIRSWTLEDGSAKEAYSESKTVTFTVDSNGIVEFN